MKTEVFNWLKNIFKSHFLLTMPGEKPSYWLFDFKEGQTLFFLNFELTNFQVT